MLSLEECRKHLGECGLKLPNERIEALRDELYAMAHEAFEEAEEELMIAPESPLKQVVEGH